MFEHSDPHRHHLSGSFTGTRQLRAAFLLVLGYMVVEVVGGVWTGSLALISDAGHMATDALGLGMALAAVVVADRDRREQGRTFGLYRLEILAALGNALLLFAVAGYVLYEAVTRLRDPAPVLSLPMLVVATGGLVVNLVTLQILRGDRHQSLNVEAARTEVLADLAGSVGAMAAAVTMITTGWPYADSLIGGLIGLFIFPRAWRLGGKAVRVLVQAAPARLDLDELRQDLAAIAGVVDVHDLHVWTLTSEMDVATVHLMIGDGTDPHPVLDQARSLLQTEHRIAHATLQVEPDTHQGCSEVSW